MLSSDQLQQFRHRGHITVPEVFDEATINAAIDDIDVWGQAFLSQLSPDQQNWYLERTDTTQRLLRKLDEPVFHRSLFRKLAQSEQLVSTVEQLIGAGVGVFFSQVFCKPPEIGGPKPVHQDNFYFGPDDLDATLTVWIALDEATVENGCLYYGDGSHLGPVYEHIAPPDQPFNLQIPKDRLHDYAMSPAPVAPGGISFHHGNTWHQSSSNASALPRRAVAMHFLRNTASLVRAALTYDSSVVVRIT